MTVELQRFQWTSSGMRPDDSEMGAMWFYRGFDTDLEMMQLYEMVELLEQSRANGDVLAELVEKTEELKHCHEHIKRADEYLSRMQDLDDDNATHHIRAIGALVQALREKQ